MEYILYRWRKWTSPEEAGEWVEALIESEDGLLSFLKAFLQQSTSAGVEDYVARRRWGIRLSSLEDFVDIEVIDRKVGQLVPDALEDEERKAIGAFQEAIRRRQEGKSDDDFWLGEKSTGH